MVSVIIPAYNCERFVVEAVNSALEQDYAHREVIVVNDGSTDGTLQVLRGFGGMIRLIGQKNAGPPCARNAGLRAARGEYVAFLDADDVWSQGKLRAQVAHLETHPEVGTVFTGWKEWHPDSDGSFRRPDFFSAPLGDVAVDAEHSGWLYNRLLFDCELLTTTVMLRASVARTVGEFDIGLWNGDDYDYWLRASRVAPISKLDCIGALYRVLPGSVSRKPREINFEHKVMLKALNQWGLVGPDGTETDERQMARRLEALVFRHAYEHLRRGDPRLALASFRNILRRHPGEARVWVYAAAALFKSFGRSQRL